MQAFRVLIILIIFFTQMPRIVYAEDYGAVYFYEEDCEGNFLDRGRLDMSFVFSLFSDTDRSQQRADTDTCST